ncbi:MAG: phage head-tail adapter protein [Verrucomicrobia bacterium]|nr:phage head-tail adapter protein [Verrucomicrobiota bacterium]
MRKLNDAVLAGLCAGGLLVCGCAQTGGDVRSKPLTQPKLLLELPDICPTPDGMAMDRAGNIILACPNYAEKHAKPAVFMKIDKRNQVSLYATCPVLAKTGVACPMGIDFGPDGGLYVCDNQGWPGTEIGKDQGRILKLTIRNGHVTRTEIVACGMSHPNGVKYKDGKLYVTQSLLPKIKSKELVSALYRFEASDREVKVNNDASDRNLLIQYKTHNMACQYGLDGLVFDSQGNLFVGNFGDGSVHKITFDGKGNVASNKLFAKSPNMRTTDGMCVDEKDNIYVADFSENAICRVSPRGKVAIVAKSSDTNGADGGLDQPGEPIARDGKLIISNFDMVTGPDKVNTKHDKPYTMSVIDLNTVKR